MVSKVTIIGIPIFLVGLIVLTLFTFVGVNLFPFWTTTNTEYGKEATEFEIISPFNIETIDLHVENLPSHPTQVVIKARFIIGPDSGSGYSCNITLMYYGSIEGRIAKDLIIDRPEMNSLEEQSITGNVPLGYSSRSYSIKIEVINTGSNPIRITNRLVEMRFSLYSTYIPAIISLIGVVVIILGLTVLKGEPSVAKRKAVAPGGWEPTLQWGGGTSTTSTTPKKKPKMAIKSTKTPTKKKATPTTKGGGGQQACKFCGKNVPSSAFFCPHCYGKLR
jgi:hypothetical protein